MSLRRSELGNFRKLLVSILCSYLLLQVCSCFKQTEKHEHYSEGESETGLARKSKNLFPFVWVTFQPSPCGSKNDGVCMQRGKCTKRGGTTSGGTCQDGFGECCTFTQRCDVNNTLVDVNQLVTTLESPTPVDTQCTFRFKKEDNICQIRLQFVSFDTQSADTEGECSVDRLRITNSINLNSDFATCGNLNDQHMYLTFGSRDSIEVTPMLTRANSRYSIIATRIPCNSVNRAPDYCLQYFTTPTGKVKSFDFGVQQQNNQQYTVCVKPTSASQQVKWTPCTTTGMTVANAFSIVGPPFQIPDGNCLTDWVQVKGEPRACDTFGETTSPWKPYELLVNFNAYELPPLPPSWRKPVVNCTTDCPDPSNSVSCDCLPMDAVPPAPQTCQCTLQDLSVSPDFDNVGFCLDYTQL